MSWFSKKLKKITKVVDPIGARLRKSTGGSYGDPMNWYQSKPKRPTPYPMPEKRDLMMDPGTGGPTIHLGGGGNYTPNPFTQQMAQVNALRGGAGSQQNMAPPMGMAPPTSVPPAQQPPMQQTQMMQNNMLRPGGRTPGMAF